MTTTGGTGQTTASLRPVAGKPAEVERLVRGWLSEGPAGEPVWVRTSGSSGDPKAVALSAPAVRASAQATAARLGGSGQWVLALPAHYVAGLQVVVRSILAGCSPVVLADHPDLLAATAALGGGRRYLAAVPTQLYRWLGDESAAKALGEYDAVLVGGSAAGDDLLARCRAAGVNVVTTYGMSETCGGCVYDGVALDGVAVALAADGRVRLAGPMLFDGYVGRPDLTAEVLHDGWLRTPDIGMFGVDGRLQVLGRTDDIVVSGGVKVPLPAVERRILTMPSVDGCAVVAVPDVEWGERVVAVIVSTQPPALRALRDFVSAEQPRAWAPREMVTVDAIPQLESGKPDRQALLRLFEATR